MVSYYEKARVGKTELSISRVGLGGAPLGNLRSMISEEQALNTVKSALQHGFCHIDTAPLYGAGTSEERIGTVLGRYDREDYTLSTKVGRVLVPSKKPASESSHLTGGPRFEAVFDFSENGIKKSIEGSKKRLRTDKFDLLFLHDCDDHMDEALQHSYPILQKMKEKNEVGAIGAGLNSYVTALKLARRQPFDCFLLAGRYTLLEQGALDEFIPFCHDNSIGVIVGGVFNSGILASGPTKGAKYNYGDAPRSVLEKVTRINEVCKLHGVELNTVALQFVLANPSVTSVVVGCKSPEEVESNSKALAERIPAEFWNELKSRLLVREDAPTP
jgi:D-threo-aldose 1-dehydrogenase